MLRDNLKGSGYITTDVNPDQGFVRVTHYLDRIPDEFPDFLYEVKERQEIIEAAESVDDRSVPTFILHSGLHTDNEVLRLLSELVLVAKKLMSALSSVRVTNRIEYTTRFLNLLDELRARIALPIMQARAAQAESVQQSVLDQLPSAEFEAEKKFNELLNLIHLCRLQVDNGTTEHFIRIVTLVCHELAHHVMVHKEFIRSEIFGHNLNYKIAQNPGKIKRVELCDSRGNMELFAVREIIVTKDRSGERDRKLMGAILTPIYGQQEVPDQPQLYVIWAGTHSKETAHADLEHICPGETCFRRGERQIAEQLVAAINSFAEDCEKSVRRKMSPSERMLIRPITIVCSGHSLGGGFAQNTFLLLQRLLVQSFDTNYDLPPYENHFRQQLRESMLKSKHAQKIQFADLSDLALNNEWIGGLCLSVWSSTRILEVSAKYSKDLLAKLAHHIQQTAYIGMVGGDPVQNFGEAALFGDLDDGFDQDVGYKKVFIPQIYMMKIEPQTTRLGHTMTAMLSSPLIGAGFGYVVGAPFTGGASVMMLALITAAAMSLSVHRAKHYETVKALFEIRYRLFCSKTLDGKPLHDRKIGIKKICEQLQRKSYVAAGLVSMLHWVSSTSVWQYLGSGTKSSEDKMALSDSLQIVGADVPSSPPSGHDEVSSVESKAVDVESFHDLSAEMQMLDETTNSEQPALSGSSLFGYWTSFWSSSSSSSSSQNDNEKREVVLLDARQF